MAIFKESNFRNQRKPKAFSSERTFGLHFHTAALFVGVAVIILRLYDLFDDNHMLDTTAHLYAEKPPSFTTGILTMGVSFLAPERSFRSLAARATFKALHVMTLLTACAMLYGNRKKKSAFYVPFLFVQSLNTLLFEAGAFYAFYIAVRATIDNSNDNVLGTLDERRAELIRSYMLVAVITVSNLINFILCVWIVNRSRLLRAKAAITHMVSDGAVSAASIAIQSPTTTTMADMQERLQTMTDTINTDGMLSKGHEMV